MSSQTIEKPIEGVIRIIEPRDLRTKFKEVIYIGIGIKSTRSKFKMENWQEEREKYDPVTSNFKKFRINRPKWYTNGELFVVPTRVFTSTKLEIYLEEHVLLGTGIEINIYHNDTTKTVSFVNTDIISTSMGGTITTTVEWQLIKTEDEMDIKFTSNEDWSTENNQPSRKIAKQ